MQLVPLSSDHIDAISEVSRDPDVIRFTRYPDPPQPGWAETYVERYARGREQGTSAGFAIVDEDGEFLGLALAPSIDPEARELELGYLVARSARGRGVAGWALAELTRWAFEDAGALRAELLIDVDNPASMRVAERCGYTREGIRRSSASKNGLRRDLAIYSRLPSDR